MTRDISIGRLVEDQDELTPEESAAVRAGELALAASTGGRMRLVEAPSDAQRRADAVRERRRCGGWARRLRPDIPAHGVAAHRALQVQHAERTRAAHQARRPPVGVAVPLLRPVAGIRGRRTSGRPAARRSSSSGSRAGPDGDSGDSDPPGLATADREGDSGEAVTGPTPAEALRLQLAMIAGRDLDARLEIRWRMPQGGMGQHFRPADKIDALVQMALEMGARTDLYVGAAPRVEPSGTKRAVARAWCLWVDCDSQGASERLRSFRPAPTLILASGREHGLHGWWALSDPLDAPRILECALRRIAHHLAGDPACCDSARIMRAAGTANHKHGDPRPVLVERLELDTFRAAEIVGGLPDPPRPARADASRRAVATGDTSRRACRAGDASRRTSDDPLLGIPATVYVPALTGREVGRDGKARCPFHDDRTPSLHAYPEPDRGWACFAGCGAGTIIDFGARLYGLEPRGAGYREIRDLLERDLRGATR